MLSSNIIHSSGRASPHDASCDSHARHICAPIRALEKSPIMAFDEAPSRHLRLTEKEIMKIVPSIGTKVHNHVNGSTRA